VNHRIFERTLRPLAFRGACLFERHINPQALLGVGRLSRRHVRRLASKISAPEEANPERSTLRLCFGIRQPPESSLNDLV